MSWYYAHVLYLFLYRVDLNILGALDFKSAAMTVDGSYTTIAMIAPKHVTTLLTARYYNALSINSIVVLLLLLLRLFDYLSIHFTLDWIVLLTMYSVTATTVIVVVVVQTFQKKTSNKLN